MHGSIEASTVSTGMKYDSFVIAETTNKMGYALLSKIAPKMIYFHSRLKRIITVMLS